MHGFQVMTCSLQVQSDSQVLLASVVSHHLALGIALAWLSGLASLSVLSYTTLLPWSYQYDLSVGLVSLGISSFCLARFSDSFPVLSYLPYDYVCVSSLYVHHGYIGILVISGSFVHLTTYLTRDSSIKSTVSIWLALNTKGSVTSTLAWVSLFLGSHVTGIFMNNDALSSLDKLNSQS